MFVGSLVEGFQYNGQVCVLIAAYFVHWDVSVDRPVTAAIDSIVELFAFGAELGLVAETMDSVPESVGTVFACNLNLLSVLIWDLGLTLVLNLMPER